MFAAACCPSSSAWYGQHAPTQQALVLPQQPNLCLTIWNDSFHGSSGSINIAKGGLPPITLAHVFIKQINVGAVSSATSAHPSKID